MKPRRLNPQRVILFLITLLLVAICATSYFAVVLRFDKLEKVFGERDIGRSRAAVENEIKNIQTKLLDWSYWDDVYQFVLDLNPAFIKSNINATTLRNLKVDCLVFVRMDGHIVYSYALDASKETEHPIPPDLRDILQRKSALTTFNEKNEPIGGMVMLREGPFLFSSQPILTSDGEGPAHGTVMMGSFLTSELLDSLGDAIYLDLEARPVSDAELPGDFEAAQGRLLKGEAIVMRELSSDKLAGYSVFKDIFGKPALILKVTAAREIYTYGLQTFGVFVVAIIVFCLLFGAAVFFPLNTEVRMRRRSEDRFRRVSEAAGELIWEMDPRGLYTFVSAASAAIYGLKPEEIVGTKYFYDFYLLGESEALKQKDFALIEKREAFVDIVRANRHASGRTIMASMSGSPFYSSERVFLGYCGVTTDVTARFEAEEKLREAKKQAEEANAFKSRFLANMSHEIRTPMNAVIGFTELLRATNMDELQRDYVSTVRDSGRVLLDLINDILAISKIEAGQLRLENIDFDLVYLVDSVLRIMRSRLAGKDVKLIADIAGGVPVCVKGDPTRVRQVLMNLVGNAVKFTEKGEIQIHLEVKEKTADLTRVRISVRDTGIGISEDKLCIIFEAFQQSDVSMVRKYGGTGLGLSISKSLVVLMGGEIGVKSTQGVGSEFFFILPFGEGQPAEAKGIRPVELGALKGVKAALVDDQSSNRVLLKKILEEAGMDVVCEAASGAALLEWLGSHEERPQLYFVDLFMPVMSGCELMDKLRAIRGSSKCIALTAVQQPGIAKTALDAGFDAFLPQPVAKDEICRVIQMLLGDHRAAGGKPEIITRHMAAEIALKGLRVLVAEDNAVNLKLMQILLKKLGCEVDLVRDGEEAVDKMKSNVYDVVLMDIQMPVIDGLQATRLIRESGNKTVPIIALTASAMKEDEQKSVEAGMNGYLTKPIDPERLRDTLMRFAQKGGVGDG